VGIVRKDGGSPFSYRMLLFAIVIDDVLASVVR